MQKRKLRRKSRQNCLQVLYSNEIANIKVEDILSGDVTLPYIEELDDYACNLIKGSIENQKEIDDILSGVSENWSVNRMPIVDKCLLRQSVFEMMYVEDVPISVSINESVELAKQFGGDDESHKFVNGVLGKIAKKIEK